MNPVIIDGRAVSDDDPCFALSVTDILIGDMLADRISYISGLAERFEHLRFICIRNDSMDGSMFSIAVNAAAATGLGLIIESQDPSILMCGLSAVPDRRPLICITDADFVDEAAVAAGLGGCPLAVPGATVESLMENVCRSMEHDVPAIILNPGYVNMKGCLETNTDLCRLKAKDFREACQPIMTRTWSGEYALSVASVSVMRGGALMVFDDLDEGSCEVLDTLMSDLRPKVVNP